MKSIIYLILLSLFCSNAIAQYTVNYRATGDQSFKDKNYYEAAYYYNKAAAQMNLLPKDLRLPFQETNVKKAPEVKMTEITYISYQLAESYRLYEDYLEAEGWYYKVINANDEGQYPLSRLWYGVCLRANQHFDEAIQQLNRFLKDYHGDAQHIAIASKEIANCKFAKEQYQYPTLVEVTKLGGDWNSDGSNYAVIKRDNNFMFTSSRLDRDDKKHLNRLYHFAVNNPKPEVINFKNTNEQKDVEYGTPTVTANGSKMYLTKWYKMGSKTIHAVYCSSFKNNDWETPVKLNANINVEGFNAIQPYITADGKHLYFVSNKPGGQGGDDIWVSDLDNDGNPINSVNLGSTINTPLDEQAPFYDEAGNRLVYSSKGFTGLGGFDLFESAGSIGNWGKPHNLGYPINSAKDDLYFFPDPADTRKFFISSDRQSDCCLELFQAADQRFTLKGIVVDCDAYKALPGVKVSFIDSLSKETLTEQTVGANAQYVFRVNNNRPYKLVLEKTGYFSKAMPVTRADNKLKRDTMFNPDICLQAFVVNKPIVLKNILYDYNRADLRPESKTELNKLLKLLNDNPKMKIELSSHTDSVGSDAYNNNLSQMRAQSCVDFIVASGINADRIFAKGYGKTKPVAPNSLPDGADNPDGRQLNRRTEFTVLKIE